MAIFSNIVSLRKVCRHPNPVSLIQISFKKSYPERKKKSIFDSSDLQTLGPVELLIKSKYLILKLQPFNFLPSKSHPWPALLLILQVERVQICIFVNLFRPLILAIGAIIIIFLSKENNSSESSNHYFFCPISLNHDIHYCCICRWKGSKIHIFVNFLSP